MRVEGGLQMRLDGAGGGGVEGSFFHIEFEDGKTSRLVYGRIIANKARRMGDKIQ
jgi:hypothetical protein